MVKEFRPAPPPSPSDAQEPRYKRDTGPRRPNVARPDSRNLLKRMRRVGLQQGVDLMLAKFNTTDPGTDCDPTTTSKA